MSQLALRNGERRGEIVGVQLSGTQTLSHRGFKMSRPLCDGIQAHTRFKSRSDPPSRTGRCCQINPLFTGFPASEKTWFKNDELWFDFLQQIFLFQRVENTDQIFVERYRQRSSGA